MRFDFELRKKIGAVYRNGNIVFVENGKSILSPVGGHVLQADLKEATCDVFPFEHRKEISLVAASVDSSLLFSFDIEGNGFLTNIPRKMLLAKVSFKQRVNAASFSPCGAYLAVSTDHELTLWKTPSHNEKDPFPLTKYKSLSRIAGRCRRIEWSSDSEYLVVSSDEMASFVFSTQSEGFLSLTSHKGACIGSWFTSQNKRILTMSKVPNVHAWSFNPEKGVLEEKTPEKISLLCGENEFVVECSFVESKNNLFVFFESGRMSIIETVDFSHVYTLSMERAATQTVTADAEWIAFASRESGRLCVFEWKSESFVLRQQGHVGAIKAAGCSEDGLYVATGDEEGKVRLWCTNSGLCKAVFEESLSSVIGIEFARQNQVLVCGYEDGRVCVFDTVRQLCFRTFFSPEHERITAVTVDRFGEFVCASLLETFRIALWSVQTSSLLETASQHTAPISSICFEPNRGRSLLSASWDSTARIQELFSKNGNTQILQHDSEVTAGHFSLNGMDVVTSTLKGEILFWSSGQLIMSVDCRNDLCEGVLFSDRAVSSHFTSVCFTPDGLFAACSGRTPFVCFYDVGTGRLHRKIRVANSPTVYDKDKANRKDLVKRKPIFLSDGESWIITAVDGALLYSPDESHFDPIEAEIETTPEGIEQALKQKKHSGALIAALKLNQKLLIKHVLLSIPSSAIDEIAGLFSLKHLSCFLDTLAGLIETSPHVGLFLRWISLALSHHEKTIRKNKTKFGGLARKLDHVIHTTYTEMNDVVSDLLGTLDYVLEAEG